jgi:hypothetical protein
VRVGNDPGELLEVVRTQPARRQCGGANDDDFVLDERLAVQLGRRLDGADDGEFGAVSADEANGVRGGCDADVDRDRWVSMLEVSKDVGKEMRRGDWRGADGEGAVVGSDALGEGLLSVTEEPLGAQHVVGDHLAARGQFGPGSSPYEELGAEFSLERGDVLGDGRLADVQRLGGA